MINLMNVKQPFFRRTVAMALALVGLSLLLVSCGSGEEEEVTIRVAMLPIMEALPLYVAEEEGFFAEHNVSVEIVPVTSAPERDQIIQAGQADAMVNEVLSTLFYNAAGNQVTIVRYARVATPEFPQYYVLASGAGGITTPDGLKGQDIGISQGTIIEYVTERLLQAEGLATAEIKTVAVPGIADRMSLLGSGELSAATLPDPLASLAIQSGAVIVVDDSAHPEYGHSAWAFRTPFIEENPDAVRGFLAAMEKAIEAINSDKGKYSNLLSERSLVPEPLLGTYVIPDFPAASVPPQSQWDDILAWALEKGYVGVELEYEDSVDDSFLP
jgi:NitT/TauT family transport system substrate-binding protein